MATRHEGPLVGDYVILHTNKRSYDGYIACFDRDNTSLKVILRNGKTIRAGQIASVTRHDPDGRPLRAWNAWDCGLDGSSLLSTPEFEDPGSDGRIDDPIDACPVNRERAELDPTVRQDIQNAFCVPDDVFDALMTGTFKTNHFTEWADFAQAQLGQPTSPSTLKQKEEPTSTHQQEALFVAK